MAMGKEEEVAALFLGAWVDRCWARLETAATLSPPGAPLRKMFQLGSFS